VESNGIWNYALNFVANNFPARILRVRYSILRLIILRVLYIDDTFLRDIKRLDNLWVLKLESFYFVRNLEMSFHAIKALSCDFNGRRLLALDYLIFNVFL